MGFNTKAAMLVSLVCIGGLAWLIHNVGAPVASLPSPLAATEGGPEPRLPAPPLARTTRLAYESPLDRQETENRTHQDALVLGSERAEPLTLPPQIIPGEHDNAPPAAERATEIVAGPPGNSDVTVDSATRADEPLQPSPAVQPPAGPAVAQMDATPDVTPRSTSERGAVAQLPPDVPRELPPADITPPTLPPPDSKRHLVRRGDSVIKIVRQYWNSEDPKLIKALVDANPKIRERQNRILEGEELVIPDLPGMTVVASDSAPPHNSAAVEPRARRVPADGRAAPRAIETPPAADAPRGVPPTRRREVLPDPIDAKPKPPAVARASEPAPALRTVREAQPPSRPNNGAPSVARGARAEPPAKAGAASKSAERSTKRVTGPLAKRVAAARNAPPSWYTIQRNDSLRTIAKRQLKDENRWREIAALNPTLRNANRLAPGERIKLPPTNVASR